MKKSLISIWRIIDFPVLYFVIQFIVSFFFLFAVLVMILSNKDMRGDELPQPDILFQQFTEQVDSNATLLNNVTLLISAVLTLALIFILFRKDGKIKEVFKFNRIGTFLIISILILGIIAEVFIVSFIEIAHLKNIFTDYEELMSGTMGNNFLLEVLTIAIAVPILEEIIFRGIVQNRLLKKMNFSLALTLQALIFAFVHLNILQGLYAFLLGIILGLVYIWTDSLWAAIYLHISLNMTSVVVANLIPEIQINNLLTVFITIISFICSFLLIRALYKKRIVFEITTPSEH